MTNNIFEKLLCDLYSHKINPEEAAEMLSVLPYENLDFANIDHHRTFRNTIPEAVYSKGKSADHLVTIIKSMHKTGNGVLATKLCPEIYRQIKSKLPPEAIYNKSSSTLVIKPDSQKKKFGNITIITAGTSDIPVAEEAHVTADLYGSNTEMIFDVGVAGIHRILDKIKILQHARVIIVVAGMDGALASVIGGLAKCPVVAVPTSVGYGASFEGLAPLLAMLNSCATGVATVNIDNGFGAGCIAHKINLIGEAANEQPNASSPLPEK